MRNVTDGVSRLTIGIDARFVDHPGIGQYVTKLLEFLPSHISVLAIVNHDHRSIVERTRPTSVCKEIRARPFTLREQIALPRTLRKAPVDVFHSPQFNVPIVWPGPTVVTIHDCAYDRYPEEFGSQGQLARLYYSFMMRGALSTADRIITVSKSTQQDLQDFYDTQPSRVAVVPHGVESNEVPQSPPNKVPSKEFFLHVGTHRPRKNIDGLLQGYATAADQIHDIPDLVLVGEHDERFLDVPSEASRLGIEDRVHELGYVGDEMLWWLYAEAVAFVFPSLYEGFGLPILEAMSVGTPVITSDCFSLAEVASDAALLVNPTVPAEIADALRKLTCDTQYRNCLARKGEARSEEYSWEQTAIETVKVYEQARS